MLDYLIKKNIYTNEGILIQSIIDLFHSPNYQNYIKNKLNI
jgi:hypothetical protein